MERNDARLARWCQEHDGIVRIGEEKEVGVAERTLLRQGERGVLERVHPGVYRHAAHPDTFESRLAAALAAAGDGAYVSGPSLMRLYGARGEWDDVPEITVLGSEHLELDGVRVRRIDRLDPVDIRPRHGYPALTPALGLLLLGASARPWKVETAVHDLVFLKYVTRHQLIDTLIRYRGSGRDGVTSFRLGIDSLDPKGKASQTNFELEVRNVLRDAGIPDPHLQHVVVDGDGKRRKLDLAWPDRMVDVETDGDRWHLNPTDRRDMKRRDAALEAVGWTVERASSTEWALHRYATTRRLLAAVRGEA